MQSILQVEDCRSGGEISREWRKTKGDHLRSRYRMDLNRPN
jgi:hypothetical protein